MLSSNILNNPGYGAVGKSRVITVSPSPEKSLDISPPLEHLDGSILKYLDMGERVRQKCPVG